MTRVLYPVLCFSFTGQGNQGTRYVPPHLRNAGGPAPPPIGIVPNFPPPPLPENRGGRGKILIFFITCFVFCKLQIGVTIHKAVMTAVRVEWDMNDLGAQWSFDYCRCLQMEDLAEEDTTRAVGATWMEGLLKASVSPVRTGDTRWLEFQSIEVLNVEKWNQSHFFNK